MEERPHAMKSQPGTKIPEAAATVCFDSLGLTRIQSDPVRSTPGFLNPFPCPKSRVDYEQRGSGVSPLIDPYRRNALTSFSKASPSDTIHPIAMIRILREMVCSTRIRSDSPGAMRLFGKPHSKFTLIQYDCLLCAIDVSQSLGSL
jgi:hypothetical protein